ncbi:Rv3235 family protein [Salinibacterium sp. ZJ454]|uniref:Rv3235 family protein n=1 Tax=Salinibacterium sp. ZJ454 TaxID=2708339 RepID=UPI001420A504|nr:Rv3235 family protein [Salinibacterium sp. ZJ454]
MSTARPRRTLSPTAGPPVTAELMPSKTIRPPYDADVAFGKQPSLDDLLPNPEPLVANLTRCVIEILAGARELEQISRWVSDDVYKHLLKRVLISARGRQARGQPVMRPAFAVGSSLITRPAPGVVEAVVVVNGRARTRAVAIRLEGLDRRWRATAIHVL